jgi:hypothetical protein
VYTHVLKAALFAWLLLWAAPVSAYHERGHEWTDRTAYTLRQGELSVGLRQLAVGVFDALTISTSPFVWAAGAIFGTAVPNLEIKLRDWFEGPVTTSLSLGFVYLDGSRLLEPIAPDEMVKARLATLTGSIAGSVRFSAAWSGSLELTYAELASAGDSKGAFVAGTAALSSLRLGAIAEWRVSRLVALRMSALMLLYRKSPDVRVEVAVNDRTTVDGELRIGGVAQPGAWQLLPAIALSGASLNFLAGVGYGYQWLPVGGLVLANPGLAFDLDFFVRF